MKLYLVILLTLISGIAWSQQDTVAVHRLGLPYYQRHSVTGTISMGFIDPYRQYSLPPDFQKNNTSGYTLVYGKLEYGLTKDISLAATIGYDAFFYNFSQLYTGYKGPIKRYKTDDLRIFSGGLTGYYHLARYIRVKHLDPFAGIGVSLNNIRHSAYAQGDSTVIKLDHTATLYLKAGARYYISDRFSLFGDVGYDKQSVFSLGFSCRFGRKKIMVK